MNKLTPTELKHSFATDTGPEIKAIDFDEPKITIGLCIPNTLSWFKGHFPEHAVLPGVVQIDWVGQFIERLFPTIGTFTQLSNVKFKTMVMPEAELSLELNYKSEKNTISFHFFDQESSYSTGIVKYTKT